MQTPSTREIADTEVRDEERPDTEHEEEVREEPRDESSELLASDDNEQFRRRWESIQTGFVDEPRETVEQADELVAQVMKRVAEGFATERERLEQQWGRGEDVSTEDLRVSLQRYRGFFERLLSA